MNPIDKDMRTKWIGLKEGISELGRKLASPGFQEKGEVLRNTQDLNMPMVEMSSGNEYPTDRTPQGKMRDNDFVDMRAEYVLCPRLSWIGLYGKAPWPQERCPCCVYEMRRVKQMTVSQDKRSEKRIACNHPVPIQIFFFNSERSIEAQVVNHCMNGVSIISNKAFLPGSAIMFKVAQSTVNGSCSTDLETLPSLSVGEVKWCRKVPAESSTMFGVGVRYFPHVY